MNVRATNVTLSICPFFIWLNPQVGKKKRKTDITRQTDPCSKAMKEWTKEKNKKICLKKLSLYFGLKDKPFSRTFCSILLFPGTSPGSNYQWVCRFIFYTSCYCTDPGLQYWEIRHTSTVRRCGLANIYLIKKKRILCSSWLPEQARLAHLARSAFPVFFPQREVFFFCFFTL